MIAKRSPLFPMGQIVATPGALEALGKSGQSPMDFLGRHQDGDWGECDVEDRLANDEAVNQGDRVFSVYRTVKGEKLWVITEADRTSTCILLPDEY
jgi:hypothetical protein